MKSLAQISQEITQNHNWVQAEHDLQVGLQAHPESAKGWYYYAQVELHQGKLVNAQHALAKADSIDPAHTFAGSIEKYNAFSQHLSSVSSNTAQVQQVLHSTTVVSHALPEEHSMSLMPFFGGVALLVIFIFVKLFKNKKNQVPVTKLPVDRYDLPKTHTRVEPTISSLPPVAAYSRSYQMTPQVQPSMSQSSQTSSGIGIGGIAAGVVGGILLDEAISGITHRNQDSNDNFDSGSSSSNDTSVFDSDSSSSDDNDDWKNSSASDDSSSFDFGSDSGGSDSSSDW